MAQHVFILHDKPNGGTGTRNNTLISAHTLKRNRKIKYPARCLNSGRARMRNLAPHGQLSEAPKRQQEICLRPMEQGALDVTAGTFEQAMNGASLHMDPVPMPGEPLMLLAMPKGPIICGQNGEDLQSIGQWYFLNRLSRTHDSHFRHAQNHWTTGLWEVAKGNPSMFAGLVAMTSYRDVSLGRRDFESSYLELKGRAIAQISKDLGRRHAKTDSLTLVAITLLAYMDVRDVHFDAARTHLVAFCNLVDLGGLPVHAWLYCAWVDLRFALLTGERPILPYYVPTPLRRSHLFQATINPRTIRRASSNVAYCPQTEAFSHHIAFDLFNKLHTLCSFSDHFGKSDSPPFGQIYDLEYALRVVQSQISKDESQCHTTAAAELAILAVQLHVWIACRFWTPQRRETHLAFMSRAALILETFEDILAWWTGVANMKSLLWITFTMAAAMRIYGDANFTPMLDLLHSVLVTQGIRCHEDFSAKLAEWPWTSNWHPCQTVHVWTLLTDRFDDLAVVAPNASNVSALILPSEPPQRLFLGGLEFFHHS
jgi:hypothetical protein